MDYRKIILIGFLLVSPGCIADKVASNNVQLGDTATAKDLFHVSEKWAEIRKKIVEFDQRNCVANGLLFDNLEFFSVENLTRLSISAKGFNHNIKPKEVKKNIWIRI